MKKNVTIKRIEKGFYKVYSNNNFVGFIAKVNSHNWEFMFCGCWREPVRTFRECKEVFEKNYN